MKEKFIEDLEKVKDSYCLEIEIMKAENEISIIECEEAILELKGRKFDHDLMFRKTKAERRIRSLNAKLC